MRKLSLACAIILSAVCCPTYSADISFHQQGISKFSDSGVLKYANIEIAGSIENGDYSKLARIIKAASDNQMQRRAGFADYGLQPVIALSSNGGLLSEAIKLGKLLREHRAWVIIPRNATCASACIVILAGGVQRHAFGDISPTGTRIGIHRASPSTEVFAKNDAESAMAEYGRLRQIVKSYFEEMGISSSLYYAMFGVPSENVRWLTRVEANDFELIGSDPGWKEWIRAKEISELGIDFIRARDRYIRCLNEKERVEKSDYEVCGRLTGYQEELDRVRLKVPRFRAIE